MNCGSTAVTGRVTLIQGYLGVSRYPCLDPINVGLICV